MINEIAKITDNPTPLAEFTFLSTMSNNNRTRNNSAISCLANAVITVKKAKKDIKKKTDRNATFSSVSFW